MVLRLPLTVWVAEFLTEDRYSGMATASRMPRMSTTTRSSMSVKAERRFLRARFNPVTMMWCTPLPANDFGPSIQRGAWLRGRGKDPGFSFGVCRVLSHALTSDAHVL